jgi:hypothetical protein
VELTRSRELGKSERCEVSARQSEFQRWSVCERCHGPSELSAVFAASCAAMPRWRSYRYLVVPRFHCFQTIDRSRRLSHFSSLSSTSGVSHRPKYPIHPRRYSAKSWTIRTRLKAVGAAPLLSSGKARRYWFFCRLSAVELRCVLIAPFIPFRGPFGPSLPSQLLRPLPPGQKRFLAPQSRIRDR